MWGGAGCVQNVAMEGGSINGNSGVGGVVGSNEGKVENCYNTGAVKGNIDVGGVVGLSIGTVENCYNTGAVSGDSEDVGGVVGFITINGTVENCYNTGAVKGNRCVGGVVGFITINGTAENCYNTGNVTGNSNVGGVVGFITINGTLGNCYNTGAVKGNSDVGGVVGFITTNGAVENCYYDKCTCQVDNAMGSGSGTNVEGLTTAQMTGEGVIGSNKSMKFTWEAGKESPWLEMNDSASGDSTYWHYPHLKGFEYDNDKSEVNWPAKIEVTVKWDSYYNGAEQNPSMNGVLVVSGDTIIPDALKKKNLCYFRYNSANGWGNVDDYSAPGYYKMEFYEDSSSPAIAIKYFSVLETGDISVNHGDSASWKDAGTYTASVILAKYGDKTVSGEFKIEPADVTITAQDKEFTYTGEAQNWNLYDVKGLVGDDEITAVVTGSITYPGESPVTNKLESYEFTTGKAGNYNVTKKNGTLTMTQARITITAASQEWVYDGQAHENKEVTITSGSLVNGDRLVASATGSITFVSDNKEGNNPVAAGYKIMHGDKDVTENYVITTVAGTLKVSSKTITITADSASKEYDGTALTKNSYTNTALVIGDTIESVTVTGSQTGFGTGANVPSAAVIKNATGEDVSSCYDITYINGSLEVTKKALTITADSASAECDGTALTKNSYMISGLAKGDSVENVTITGSQTGPGSGDNVPSAATIVNAAGEDVTDCYDITYVNGTLTVSEHSFDKEVADAKYQKSAADCTHAAVYYKSCKCGEKGTETFESGEPLGHDYKAVEGTAVAPTCEKPGKEADQKCERCGDVINGKEIPATGHTWKAATGYAPKTCEICGATEGDVIKYTVEGGNTIEFTQGDTNNVVRTYHRSEDDKHAIDHHKGVQIDGKDVKVDAKSGSVIITFDAATLNALSVGDHVIKVIFDDWVDELKLVIKAPVTPAVDTTPTTGDSSLPVLWVTMLLLSMAGAAVVVEKRRRA